jgi:hypothetical protein
MDRNNQSAIKGIHFIIGILVMLSFGCNSFKYKYGVHFNAERKKLGIPLLPSDWNTDRNFWNNEYIIWRSPLKDCRNCFDVKSVLVKNDKILIDHTEFISDITYEVDETYSSAHIGFTYCFTNVDSSLRVGMNCLYYHDAITHYTPEVLTIDQADSIINVWKKINSRFSLTRCPQL